MAVKKKKKTTIRKNFKHNLAVRGPNRTLNRAFLSMDKITEDEKLMARNRLRKKQIKNLKKEKDPYKKSVIKRQLNLNEKSIVKNVESGVSGFKKKKKKVVKKKKR